MGILTFANKAFILLVFVFCGCVFICCTLLIFQLCFGDFLPSITNVDKRISAPASSEILQREHEDQLIYVCLIEKFYPDVIRVTWTDEEKEVTEDVVRGDTWQLAKEEGYSVASWLTVPAHNKDKNYYCKYEHESQQQSLSTQVNLVETAPQEEKENCTTVFNEDVMLPDVILPDHLMHRTAYLVYIILLLKSSMYYVIILFFTYRMWAPSKHQGKKV